MPPKHSYIYKQSDEYFARERIDKLKKIKNPLFDLFTLINTIDSINYNYKREDYLSCAPLLRKLIDHIPPIF
jgi:hypothetical protein